MVEVAGHLASGRVADGKLGNLDEPGLDRVGEAEVAHDPREGPVRVLTHPAEEVRCRREVQAEVDSSQRVDAVQALDPDRGLLEELLGVLLVLVEILLRLGPPDAVRVVGLVVQHQDVLLAPHLAAEHPVDDARVALDEPFALDLDPLEVPLFVALLVEHGEEAGGELAIELLGREVAAATDLRRLRSDVDRLPDEHAAPRPQHPPSDAAHLHRPRLEHMPVRHDHAPAPQVGHQVGGHEVTRPVEASLALAWVQFAEAAADRHVRADDEDRVREAPVGAIGDLVQDAPGREHPHHRGLSGARRHLAGEAPPRGGALGLPLLTRLVGRHVEALQEVRARLVEEHDGLRRLDLGEEEPPLATLTPPVPEELERRARDAWVRLRGGGSPGGHTLTNAVHEPQLDLRSGAARTLFFRPTGRPVEVGRQAAARGPHGFLAGLDSPVLPGLLERGVEDWLGDLELAHRRNALRTPSSFSRTSGWISSGVIRAAISW